MTRSEQRGSLMNYLSGVKTNCAQMDQAHNTDIAWAVDLLKIFNNPEVKVPRFDIVLDEYVEDIDPNDTDRIICLASQRTPEWLLGCWQIYGRDKYREAITMWNTQTGLGDGDHSRFGKFCGNRPWLSWVYAIDCDSE